MAKRTWAATHGDLAVGPRAKARSVTLAIRGIRRTQDIVTLMTALVADVAAGRLPQHEAATLARRASLELLRVLARPRERVR